MNPEPARDVDLETVTRRLTHLRQVLDDLRPLCTATAADLDRDRVTRYAVERMLTLLVASSPTNTRRLTWPSWPRPSRRRSMGTASTYGRWPARCSMRRECVGSRPHVESVD